MRVLCLCIPLKIVWLNGRASVFGTEGCGLRVRHGYTICLIPLPDMIIYLHFNPTPYLPSCNAKCNMLYSKVYIQYTYTSSSQQSHHILCMIYSTYHIPQTYDHNHIIHFILSITIHLLLHKIQNILISLSWYAGTICPTRPHM